MKRLVRINLLVSLLALLSACSIGGNAPIPVVSTPTAPLQDVQSTATPVEEGDGAEEEMEIAQTPAMWEVAECQFEVPSHLTVECGYLIVPEARDVPDTATIRLHVAIVRSENRSPAPDPLLYLQGGPGGHALDSIGYIAQSLSPLLRQRDLIILEQRGIGYSTPSLDCPESDEFTLEALEQGLTREEEGAKWRAAMERCYERLVSEGHNLSAYHSAAIAADGADLRKVLGYEQWNLYGASYGTRIAQTVMRDHPEGVRSVILDSPVPIQSDLRGEWATNGVRAINLLFEACAADARCNAHFPDLPHLFHELVRQFDNQPLTVQILVPGTYELRDLSLDGDDLIEFIFESLYDSERIALLPKVIYEVRAGNMIRLSDWIEQGLGREQHVSEGMGLAVLCREEVPFSQGALAPEASGGTNGLDARIGAAFWQVEMQVALCDLEIAEAAPALENVPVQSNLPTLILAGEFDPVTPPRWGQLLADTLGNAYFYEFPGVGHGVLGVRRCAGDIAADFIASPAVPPDATCVRELQRVFLVQ